MEKADFLLTKLSLNAFIPCVMPVSGVFVALKGSCVLVTHCIAFLSFSFPGPHQTDAKFEGTACGNGILLPVHCIAATVLASASALK